MKKNNAFTLIEILVVATIISLLAAGAAVSYSQFSKQSRDAKRKADLENIRMALEQYRSTNDTYPLSLTFGTGTIVDGAGNIYMGKVPQDPQLPTRSYQYWTNGSTYNIFAALEQNSTCAFPGAYCVVTCNYCLGPYGEL